MMWRDSVPLLSSGATKLQVLCFFQPVFDAQYTWYPEFPPSLGEDI